MYTTWKHLQNNVIYKVNNIIGADNNFNDLEDDNDINTLGVHQVTIVLHKEVSFTINIKLSSL